MKALVDAASNALKLIETIKNQSTGKVSREDVARCQPQLDQSPKNLVYR